MSKKEVNNELLINLAKDYYLDNIPIVDLVKKYNLSRYLILKNLGEANKKGIVNITINFPFMRNTELEKFFKNSFKTKVKVLKYTEALSKQEPQFYDFCAKIVQEEIDRSTIVALSWGDSVYRLIDHFKLTMRKNLTFTQFIGEIGKYQSLAGSMRLVQKAAGQYEASYLTLSIPLYILNQDIHQPLKEEPTFRSTLSTAKKADLLITGLATPDAINSVDVWNQNKELLFGPTFKDAIGMVYGRCYDIDGNFLNQAHDKTFGLALDDILNIPQRIAICNKKFKAKACLGALMGNFFTELIIDEKTALTIIQLMKRNNIDEQ
jgi:DNA-binding transcriptional regulator LsrR (DeoR family)